jgi:hypothetical protein
MLALIAVPEWIAVFAAAAAFLIVFLSFQRAWSRRERALAARRWEQELRTRGA